MADHLNHEAPGLDRTTRLAFDRNCLACQRTMHAWVRTATSLITFGFAIYSFPRIVARGQASSYFIGPHLLALMMVITFEAMMTMRKIDVAAIEAARRG